MKVAPIFPFQSMVLIAILYSTVWICHGLFSHCSDYRHWVCLKGFCSCKRCCLQTLLYMPPAVRVQEFLFGVHLGAELLGKHVNVHISKIMPKVSSKVVATSYPMTSNVSETLSILSLSNPILPISFTFLLLEWVWNGISLCVLAIFVSPSVKYLFGSYVQISVGFVMLFKTDFTNIL